MNKSLLNLGIPDLPVRAFIPVLGKIKPQGGGKGSAPDTPDYEAAAKETAKGNLEAAKYATQANRPTQITPWGTVSWDNGSSFDQAGYDAAMQAYQNALSGGGQQVNPNYELQMLNWENQDVDRRGRQPSQYLTNPSSTPTAPNRNDFYTEGNDWTQTVTLNPQMQAILDQQLKLQEGLFGAQNSAADRVNQMMGQGFDTSSFTQGGTPLDIGSLPGAGSVYDPTVQTNNATELLMNRLNPELDRQQERLRSQLANQGIAQGSEAYNNAMQQFTQQRNDAANQAALAGINLGMQQQGQTFGQQTTNQQLAAALQAQQFGQSDQARARDFQEAAYLRGLPLNELNALRTGNQVSMPQFPGYAQQATTGGPDMLGAANQQYSADLGAYNAQQAQGSGLMGGLLGLGGLGLKAYGAGLFDGGLQGIATVPF